MSIGKHEIGELEAPYVIAEIGVNHEGSLQRAMHLIEAAATAGADAVKFQTYKADALAVRDSPAYWDVGHESTSTQHELFSKYDSFTARDYEELAQFSDSQSVDFLSTPFDSHAVMMLTPLVAAMKVASADITNVPLLRAVGATHKPVILSTGASNLDEIRNAVFELESSGAASVGLLHCILAYPTSDDEASLGMIRGLREEFPGHVIGYSDHTLPDQGLSSLVGAVIHGARILEKHFTDDKHQRGNDHYHAMDMHDLAQFRRLLDVLEQKQGMSTVKTPTDCENAARLHARRSIVVARDVEAGKTLAEDDLVTKRPGTGICASLWDKIVGMTAKRDLKPDNLLCWDDLM